MNTMNSYGEFEMSITSNMYMYQDQKWTKDEDQKLLAIVKEYGPANWKYVTYVLGTKRTGMECFNRYNKYLRPGVKKGSWTGHEDEIVKREVNKCHGKIKWSLIASKLKGRLGKQVRDRWFNHLDPAVWKGEWTGSESRILYESQKILGNRWCMFMKVLPGRSENLIKNRWYGGPMRKWMQDNNEELPANATCESTVAITEENCVDLMLQLRETLLKWKIDININDLMLLFSINWDDISSNYYHDGVLVTYDLEKKLGEELTKQIRKETPTISQKELLQTHTRKRKGKQFEKGDDVKQKDDEEKEKDDDDEGDDDDNEDDGDDDEDDYDEGATYDENDGLFESKNVAFANGTNFFIDEPFVNLVQHPHSVPANPFAAGNPYPDPYYYPSIGSSYGNIPHMNHGYGPFPPQYGPYPPQQYNYNPSSYPNNHNNGAMSMGPNNPPPMGMDGSPYNTWYPNNPSNGMYPLPSSTTTLMYPSAQTPMYPSSTTTHMYPSAQTPMYPSSTTTHMYPSAQTSMYPSSITTHMYPSAQTPMYPSTQSPIYPGAPYYPQTSMTSSYVPLPSPISYPQPTSTSYSSFDDNMQAFIDKHLPASNKKAKHSGNKVSVTDKKASNKLEESFKR